MDAPTLSAFAAAGAAVAAASVAAIQLYVGSRQADAAIDSARAAMMNAQSAGRHTVAEFRQAWIHDVRDILCEYHAILVSDTSGVLTLDEARTLSTLRMKLELLLNPNETDANDLLTLAHEIQSCETLDERILITPKMTALAHKILKTEWRRIKSELR